MKINFTTNIFECIYSRDIATIIKNRDWLLHEEEAKLPAEATAIYGNDISHDDMKIIATPVNPEVAYIFFKRNDGLLQPVHVTYTRKTLNNFAKAEKRFGHLRPENELY